MRKPTLRRIIAFLVDMVIISIITSSLSSIKYINPSIDEYNKSYDELVEFLDNGLTAKDAGNILNSEKYKKLTYDLSYNNRYGYIITLVVTILYFVGFQYYTNGFTGGKKLMNIKVESQEGKLTIKSLLLRSLIVNSLITTLLNILAIFLLTKSSYMRVSMYIELLEMGLLFVTFGMILYREDGRGLHDLLAKTKVVFNK
jgi:uncharacterized RDD family membrane protein YckC